MSASRRHLRLVAAALVVSAPASLAACANVATLCEPTKLEALSAKLGQGPGGERSVRLSARVVDEHGQPIPEADVLMTIRYGRSSEEAGGPAIAGGVTDANGVATDEVPTRVIRIGAAAAGVFPIWGAQFDPTGNPAHTQYCRADADAPLPDAVIRLGS